MGERRPRLLDLKAPAFLEVVDVVKALARPLPVLNFGMPPPLPLPLLLLLLLLLLANLVEPKAIEDREAEVRADVRRC